MNSVVVRSNRSRGMRKQVDRAWVKEEEKGHNK